MIKGRRLAIMENDHALIPLGINAKGGFAIVDVEDSWVDDFLWYLSDTGYALTTKLGTHTRMHHLIMGKPLKGQVIDHINRDRLDNRKSNLRMVTLTENARNANRKSSKYLYRGIRPNGKQGWMAYLTARGKQVYLGTYKTIELAAEAYNKGAKKHFGEYAILNNLEEST